MWALSLGAYKDYCTQLKSVLNDEQRFENLVLKIVRRSTGQVAELETGANLVERATGLRLVQSNSGTIKLTLANTAQHVAKHLAANPKAQLALQAALMKGGEQVVGLVAPMMPRFAKALGSQWVSAVKNINSGAMMKLNIVLTAGFLAADAIHNIYRWWNGEISGARASKNVVDATASVLGGFGGCSAGTMVGSYAGPVGAGIGCAVGSIVGSNAASSLSDHLTQSIFGIPPSEALENAYRYFGVSKNADTEDINKIFRRLSKQYHPDKPGGSHSKFIEVNTYLEVIRASREKQA